MPAAEGPSCIQVAVRVKPVLPPSEASLDIPSASPEAVSVPSPTTLLVHPVRAYATGKNTYEFDAVFGPSTTNPQVFAKLGPALVQSALSGINASLFCYGQTASGKTYTMFGSHYDEGIAQRTIRALMTATAHENVTIFASQFEIYNEKVRDLLADCNELRVREHPVTGPYLEGLTRVQVSTSEKALEVLSTGMQRSAKGETRVNAHSSRSHVVFQLQVSIMRAQDNDHEARFESRLCLVDLAGSERTQKSHAQGTRLKEAANINTSLMTLGLVINALSAENDDPNAQPSEHVPYRNSVLTWLMRDSLGGNAQTTILATVSPDSRDLDETLSTLRYCERAKTVVNQATVNRDPTSALILALKAEIEELRRGRGDTDAAAKIAQAEKRAADAERASKERAELLWASAEQLRNEMTQAIEAARLETQIALERQEREEVLPLVDECSALRIQCCWRRYVANKLRKALDHERRGSQRHNEELAMLRQENAAMKIQSLRHYRSQRLLAREAGKFAEDASRAASEAQRLQKESEQARIEAEKRRLEQEQAVKRRQEVELLLSSKANEMLRVVEAMAQRERALEDTAKAVKTKEQEAHQLASKVAELEGRLQAETLSQTDRQRQLSELAAYQRELKATRAKADALESSNAMASKEVTALRELVRNKDADILRLQEEMAAKRVQVTNESETLRQRVAELESLMEQKASSSAEHEKKLKELERLNEQLRASDLKERRLREQETELLRERVRAVEANAIGDLEKLNAELHQREKEASERAAMACELLKIKLEHTASELAKSKATTAAEIKDRERKLAEMERTKKELEEREAEERRRLEAEMAEMRRCVLRLEKELKDAKVGAPENVRRVKELERLNEQLRRRGGEHAVKASPSTSASSSHSQVGTAVMLRVDFETFFDPTASFMPVTSYTVPGSQERSFVAQSPLYSLEACRYSRFVVQVLSGRVGPVTEAWLDHKGFSRKHKLKVVKTETAPQGHLVACVLDWATSEADDGCFCLGASAEATSGPMSLMLQLSTTSGRPVRWEYPLSFKAGGKLAEAGQSLSLRVGLPTRATDKERCGFVNAGWYDLNGGLVKDPTRVVALQGYLLKRGAHFAQRRVRRYFVLAPPFLLCYDSLQHAAQDFTKGRALPHSANSAMRVCGVCTRPVADGEFEFEVEASDKKWVLGASNKEDAERWVHAVAAWTKSGSGVLTPAAATSSHLSLGGASTTS